MIDGFGVSSCPGQRGSEIAVRFEVVRQETNRLGEMWNGFVDLSLSGQRETQIVVRFRVAGMDAHGLGVVGDRFVEAPFGRQRVPEVALRAVVASRDATACCHSATLFLQCCTCARAVTAHATITRTAAARMTPNRQAASAPQQVGNPPRHDDEQADERDVRVAIGDRLAADLDEADDWNERDQIPQPSDEQVRVPPTRADRERRDSREQDERRPATLPDRRSTRDRDRWPRVRRARASSRCT